MYSPDSLYRQMQWQRDPKLLPLRLSHCNRIANMRKQLFQLIDDRMQIEIEAYALLHPRSGTVRKRPLPMQIRGSGRISGDALRILQSLRSLRASA